MYSGRAGSVVTNSRGRRRIRAAVQESANGALLQLLRAVAAARLRHNIGCLRRPCALAHSRAAIIVHRTSRCTTARLHIYLRTHLCTLHTQRVSSRVRVICVPSAAEYRKELTADTSTVCLARRRRMSLCTTGSVLCRVALSISLCRAKRYEHARTHRRASLTQNCRPDESTEYYCCCCGGRRRRRHCAMTNQQTHARHTLRSSRSSFQVGRRRV